MHAIKECAGGSKTPLILNLGTTWIQSLFSHVNRFTYGETASSVH
jgi:hypothetical protein